MVIKQIWMRCLEYLGKLESDHDLLFEHTLVLHTQLDSCLTLGPLVIYRLW